ncbi:MAG: cytochrome c3 family protein, partial [Planctomycetota bacterium]
MNKVNTRTSLSALILISATLLLTVAASCRKAGSEETGRPPQSGESSSERAHGPDRKCELCHGRQNEQQIASAEVKLIAKLPELCLRCHPEADYSNSTEVVHGPLAVAECLFCHDPHTSQNEHLLKKTGPEMCYGCHEKDAVEAIADHAGAEACLSCHMGHSGRKKALLKETAP